MKYINLTNSDKRATCDDDMYETLNKYEWFLDDNGHAATYTDHGTVLMEQIVMLGEHFYEKD